MTFKLISQVVLVLVLVATLSGCELMKRISEGAYRNAVADSTVAELRNRGIPMAAPPECGSTATGAVVHVHCTGRTTTGGRVEVTGRAVGADTRDPVEHYVITLDGREVLRGPCLGTGCRQGVSPQAKVGLGSGKGWFVRHGGTDPGRTTGL